MHVQLFPSAHRAHRSHSSSKSQPAPSLRNAGIRNLLAWLACAMTFAAVAHATAPANADFETGSLDPWAGVNLTVVGAATVNASSNIWSVTPAGSSQARLQPAGAQNQAAAYAALGLDAAAQAAFLVDYPQPTNFAYVYQTVALNAGDTISLAWNYVATDNALFNDASIASFVCTSDTSATGQITVGEYAPVSNSFAILGSTSSHGNYITGGYGATGWQTVKFTATATGTWKIGFAAFNLKDTIAAPVLFLDAPQGTTLKNGVLFGPIPPNGDVSTPPAKTTPTITWAAPAAITYGTALSGTQLNATTTVAGTFTYTPAAGTVLNAGAGQVLSVSFAPTDTSLYNSATGSTTITVNKADQTITFNALSDKTTSDPAFNVSATATSALPVTFSIVSGPATISGSTVTLTGAGTVTVRAAQAGDGNYNPASAVDRSFTVSKTAATVTLSNLSYTYDGTSKQATVTTNPASLTITVTYAGSSTAPTNAGTYAVVATVSDANYAGTASGTLTIAKAAPTVSWSSPAAISYGTALSGTQLNASATVAGSFVYSPAAGSVLNAGSQTLGVTFTPTDSTNFSTASASTTITVQKAVPTVSWSTPAAITYGTALSSTQLNASANVPGTFVYSPAAGSTLNAGAGQTLSVAFTPTDATNYTTASGSTTITVQKATPAITWPTPAAITYGTALSSTQLNASANVTGTFSYSPAAGSVLNAGAGQTLAVTFTPADNANYTTASASTTLSVQKATPTLSWSAPAEITYGTALSSTQLNASANVAGAFVYSPAAGATLNAGANQALSVSFTPTDATNYTTASSSTTITVQKATPSLTWSTPASITYGTALSSTQLNASANVPGSFVYSPAAGATLNAGAGQTLNVSFTPTDATNYTTASTSTTISVQKATPTVSWTTPAAITYGTALSSTQLNATANVPGSFVYTPAAGTVLTAGAGQTLNVAFTPTDGANYTTASASTTLSVQKAGPTITWPTPAAVTYGTPLSSTQLNATADVPGTFTYSPAAGTYLNAGASQVLNVSFTPTDAANYGTASATATITVDRAVLTVRANDQTRTYGVDNPAFTASITGYVRGETQGTAGIAGEAALTCTATRTSSIGEYPIQAAVGTLAASNYSFVTATGKLTITAASADVTLSVLSQLYTGSPRSVGVSTSPAGLPVSVTYNGSATAPTSAGNYAVVATVTDPNYSASATGTLVISKVSQTVTLAGGTPVIGKELPLSASASSGLPVSLAITSGNARLVGSSLVVLDAAPVVVRATQSGDANHFAATAERTFTAAGKLDQTIAFAPIPDCLSNSGAFALNATASSGLPVGFTIVSGPAMLSGSTLIPTGVAGTVVVKASQPGNANYNPAPEVTTSFRVVKASVNVFFGEVTNGANATKAGDVAAVMPPGSREGSLLIVAPGIGVNTVLNFSLNADGSFYQTLENLPTVGVTEAGAPARSAASALLTARGALVNGRLTGVIEPLGVSFSANVLPVVGSSADAAGFYTSSTLATTTGTTYSIVGTNNEILVLAQTPVATTGGRSTLAANGSFNLQAPTQSGAATITGSVDQPSTTVSGTINVPGKPEMNFAGLITTASRTDRLVNLSSRVRVGGGERVLITGFVIGGTEAKQVLIRGVGPGLAGFGVNGVLTNPKIRVYRGTEVVAENDDWATADNATALATATSRIGAFALADKSSDAALLATLQPGAYSVQVLDGGGSGVALAEIYDASANPNSEYQRLVNISTRGEAGAGENVLIGGFVVTGNSPKKLLVRGIGPGLTAFGVAGALTDPKLRVYSGSSVLAENDNWSSVVTDTAALTEAARKTGAFALAAGSKDSAVVVTLAPGAYTAQVSANDGQTGVALVEIYELPEN